MKRAFLPIVVIAAAAAVTAAFVAMRPEEPVLATIPGQQGGFSGRVVDGITGKPLPAAVSVVGNSGNAVTIRCDENGFFKFGLDDGSYVIRPSFEGYVLRGNNDPGRKISVLNATQFVNAKLSLWPQATIKGRVTADDRGIAAHIRLFYQTDASGAQNYDFKEIDAGADGYFSIAGAYAGVAGIAVSAPGFASQELSDIVLQFGDTTDVGTIPVIEGFSVFGNVVDAKSGQAISGASIRMVDAKRKTVAEATSSGAGNYRLPAVSLRRVWIAISAEGYQGQTMALQLAKEPDVRQNFSLRRAWGLEITVDNQRVCKDDGHYEPVCMKIDELFTTVTVTNPETGEKFYNEKLKNGTYFLEDLRGGPFIVKAEDSDYSSGQHNTYQVRAMAGDSVRLTLKRLPSVVLHFVRSDGTPVMINSYSYSYASESDIVGGGFNSWDDSEMVVTDLDPGSYIFTAPRGNRDVACKSSTVHLEKGDFVHVNVLCTQGGTIRGRVFSSRSHRGLNAEVSVEYKMKDPDAGGETGLTTVKTDRNGNYVIDGLPDATLNITVHYEDGEEKGSQVLSGLDIREDNEIVKDFEITLKNTRRRFPTDENGNPIRPPWGQPPTDENGNPIRPPWMNGDWKPPTDENGNPIRPPWMRGDGENGEGWKPPTDENGNPIRPPWMSGDGENGEGWKPPTDADGNPIRPPWMNGDGDGEGWKPPEGFNPPGMNGGSGGDGGPRMRGHGRRRQL